jgi:hypothetical protein
MYANPVKGRIAIVLSIFLILLGVALSVASSQMEEESKGINISYGHSDNGKLHKVTKPVAYFENPEESTAAKFFGLFAVVLYIGGAVGIIYGVALCVKGVPKDTMPNEAPAPSVFCRNCGARNSCQDTFCSNCGTALSSNKNQSQP